jgi:hypothetical protein
LVSVAVEGVQGVRDGMKIESSVLTHVHVHRRIKLGCPRQTTQAEECSHVTVIMPYACT